MLDLTYARTKDRLRAVPVLVVPRSTVNRWYRRYGCSGLYERTVLLGVV